ncbi:hypothetical protein EGJ52_23445 [Pseudomonas luteola]|uniref:hypothetical protein n=1 Tax=Pseudomonas luteola TaxID=47886 RepID=UPI000F78A100|nr:hypothetical protein [Pseudomonas luteola]RRW39870.1 hypothetical protein EGJ52_23445 [Pseudomonas luteola]
MHKRPTSITVIAWILIVIGVISAISTVVMTDNPMIVDLMKKSPIPIPLQYTITTIGLLIIIVSGIAMLNGRNWARFLYVIWSTAGLLINLSTSPEKATLFPALIFLAIVTIFLFRPKANKFFLQKKSFNDAQPT